jgi:hypothetical protein
MAIQPNLKEELPRSCLNFDGVFMNILIIGFQRSGTTLLRRLIQLHPQVKRIFHESALLKKYNDKKILLEYVKTNGIKLKKDNWGEKVPYYPTAKQYPIVKYCKKWEDYFGDKSRILHVVRHPYDVAFSILNKFDDVVSIDKPIKIYRNIIRSSVPEINKLKSTFTFKYEDLLLNSDEMMFKIYEHCGLSSDFDFKREMINIENPLYQNINPERAFAYKRKDINSDYKLKPVIEILNTIDGPKYEL